MSGYNNVLKIRRFEDALTKHGLRMGYPKYRNGGDTDMVALSPADDNLPIYSRDAELFVGTIDAASYWLKGIEWARDYDRMLRLTTDTKRKRKEQDERNRQLIKQIATSTEV